MAHFAHVNDQNIVDAVIVIDRDVITANNGWVVKGVHKPLSEWVQTSYNVRGGKYDGGDIPRTGTAQDIKARERKNYAGIGFTYDPVEDVFVPPKKFDSWVLNPVTKEYDPPTPLPKDGKDYRWSETLEQWVERIK